MPSRRPLDWAVSPASARPSVRVSSSKPRRWATTAAHRVRTGAQSIAGFIPGVDGWMVRAQFQIGW
jgi:hypothetical protein